MGRRGKKHRFDIIVKDKKLPILTLDNRWHELFPEGAKNSKIRELEQLVNNHLKTQGRLVNDIKDLKKLKSSLMNDIVENMDVIAEKAEKAKDKKMDRNKQYIEGINERLDRYTEELADIPYKIKEANERLMIESIKICYQRMSSHKEELDKINEWISNTRKELKMKILSKNDMEEKNTQIYSYVHDILGADMTESFDKEFGMKRE